ncbi:hypothetical protein [Meiothermus phage MMP17]|nr:hypothetical protein [Meiothermus phage MMP17]
MVRCTLPGSQSVAANPLLCKTEISADNVWSLFLGCSSCCRSGTKHLHTYGVNNEDETKRALGSFQRDCQLHGARHAGIHQCGLSSQDSLIFLALGGHQGFDLVAHLVGDGIVQIFSEIQPVGRVVEQPTWRRNEPPGQGFSQVISP